MGITVLKHNVPWGPFSRAQLEEGLKRGDFTLQYLAHAPGLKDWLPLGEVLDHVERGAILPPVPLGPPLPQIPPVPLAPPVPQAPPVPDSREITPPTPPALPKPGNQVPIPQAPPVSPVLPVQKPEVRLPTAPFIPRGIAFLIDCGVLFIPLLFFFALGALTIELQGWWERTDHESMHQEWLLLERNLHQLLLLFAVGLGWLYAAGLECSRWQATIGKQWMGMKVTDAQGHRLGFLQASGRYAAKYLSALPCFLGFIAALFSARGLTLHDRLANTRVIRS